MPSVPPHPSQPDVGRRALALWACLLWILGFEIAPDVHLGTHASLAPHRHATHAEDHDHGRAHEHHDAEHEHHHADHEGEGESEHEDTGEHAELAAIDLDHGRHDLLHRGIAVLPPAPAWAGIADAEARARGSLWLPARIHDSRAPRCVRARGPPRPGVLAASSWT